MQVHYDVRPVARGVASGSLTACHCRSAARHVSTSLRSQVEGRNYTSLNEQDEDIRSSGSSAPPCSTTALCSKLVLPAMQDFLKQTNLKTCHMQRRVMGVA